MDPKDPESWILRGACYVGVQKFDRALEDVKKVFKQIAMLEEMHKMDCSSYLAKYTYFSIFKLPGANPCKIIKANLQPSWPSRLKTNVSLLFYFLKLYNFGFNEIFVGSTSSELHYPHEFQT